MIQLQKEKSTCKLSSQLKAIKLVREKKPTLQQNATHKHQLIEASKELQDYCTAIKSESKCADQEDIGVMIILLQTMEVCLNHMQETVCKS